MSGPPLPQVPEGSDGPSKRLVVLGVVLVAVFVVWIVTMLAPPHFWPKH
ncbi:MAG: hypothetical protein ACRD4H_03265 [Candidatus Acidiferrales bacterium]